LQQNGAAFYIKYSTVLIQNYLYFQKAEKWVQKEENIGMFLSFLTF